jgi:Sulfotransferase family
MEIGAAMNDEALFLTGTQRSGSTLLEKMLGAQNDVSVLSQPFPLLFVEVKREFLRTLGVADERYPLGHAFRESRYTSDAFAAFLAQWRTSPSDLAHIFAVMSDYSGQYTKFTPEQLADALATIDRDDDFASVVAKLSRALSSTPGQRWFGSKETMCEEFVPALLDRGFRCVVILRDPRDVLASLNYGRGHEFGGLLKPTWFNIRSWRKSVAVAMAMRDHHRFHWCRYEDIVADPMRALTTLSKTLGLEIDPSFAGDVRDTTGAVWRGNSSHGEHHGVSDASIGIYRKVLDPDVAAVVEASCLPELQWLGYSTSKTLAEARDVIEQFREPYDITRTGMESDAATAENARLEIERLERINDVPGSDSLSWFRFESVHAQLREIFRS